MHPDDLALWKRRLSIDRGNQAIYHSRWSRAIRLFDTTYWDDIKVEQPGMVEVNYSTTFITTLVSSLIARAPKWIVKSTRPGRFYHFAETMQVLMDQFKDESMIKKLAVRCVVDTATCNVGWIEQGFFQSVKDPIPSPETGQDEASLTRRMGDLLRSLGGNEKNEPAQQGELQPQKRPGSFYMVRRSPWDVILPAGQYEYESLPYLFVRERMTWGDFFDNPRYINQDRMGTLTIRKTNQKLDEVRTSPFTSVAVFNPKAPSASMRLHDPDRPVEIYTCWDRRENQVFSFSETSDEVHEEPKAWPYFADGFPQKPLQFNYVPEIPDERDNFYGFSDIDPIEAQVLEKSDLRTQQSAIRKRAIVKVFVQQGSSTESVMNKLQSPDIEVIAVPNIQAIQISPPIAIPPAVLQTEERIDSDLSRDSGLPLLLSDIGQVGKIQKATTANLAAETTTLKTSYKVDSIETWLKDLGRYQIGLYWQFLSEDEVAERLGRLLKPGEWIPLPEDINLAKKRVKDELVLSVEGGSTKPINIDVVERNAYMNSLAVIHQIDPALFRQISRPAIAQLIKRFNIPELEAIVDTAMDAEEQQTAEMENQLMLKGMLQVVGPNDDHFTHLKVHQEAIGNPIVDAHIQAHQMRLEELAGAQQASGQGVRQKAAAPSAAEVGRKGNASAIDSQGAGNRVPSGTSLASKAQQNA